MKFEEAVEGDCRIYVGALDAPRGDGYIAAVVVQRFASGGVAGSAGEIWRDDNLAGGHRWASAEAALRYAMVKARAVARSRAAVAMC